MFSVGSTGTSAQLVVLKSEFISNMNSLDGTSHEMMAWEPERSTVKEGAGVERKV